MNNENSAQNPEIERKKPTTKEMLAWYQDYLKRRDEGTSNEYCDILDTMECLVEDSTDKSNNPYKGSDE